MTELKKDYCADGKSYYQGGVFYPDQTPLELPLGYEIPETLESMIARMIHSHEIYNNPEADNVDEADDLDVMDEEPIMASRHEFTEMQEEHYRKEKREAFRAADEVINQLGSDKTKPQGKVGEAQPEGKQGTEAAMSA